MTDHDDMEPITRKEIRDLFAALYEWLGKEFATVHKRFEQIDKRSEQVDKRFERMSAETNSRFAEMDRRFAEASTDLARHASAIMESTRSDIRAIDDKYKDLPPRVTKLEDQALPPPRRRKRRAG